ncbi:MAG: glycosyltransferase, partial [Chlamydiae bacterium]|nr:glycosyltransferase [Chlamydiota bacterium]
YVAASRLVPYKRIDLIVDAFSLMPSRRLVVVGVGPEEKRLKKRAGKNIEFLGFQEDGALCTLLQNGKGFVFAALEDFGILPVEAMASGTPVIGLKRGGLCETVQEGVSGLFFDEPSASSICNAVERFEKMDFEPKRVRERAEMFRKERFQKEFSQFVAHRYEEFKGCTSSF